MVTACLLALATLSAPDADADDDDADPTRATASALGKGRYPWYDAEKDAVKSIAPARVDDEGPRIPMGAPIGNVIATALFLVVLGLLIAALVWLYRFYEPGEGPEVSGSKGRGGPSRVEALPEGMRREFESSDPWEEALRRRARGDLAGAVVCLFAHQLLTLSRLGLVRLAPGRTGRQLVRAVADANFRGLSRPTLRQFEAVYYGHRTPTPEEFAEVWANAEAFERRVAEGLVV